ncbi:MAG: redoxin domain-containing protein [Candidatus Promineifilaceae bacterium]
MIKKLLSKKKNANGSISLDNYPRLLEPGEYGPDFSLRAVTGRGDSEKMVSLGDLRGKSVVLVFYPKDGTAVCGSQLALYNEALELLEEQKAHIVAISVDSLDTHLSFAKSLDLAFPLLSDDNPAGAVASAYGVFNEDDGLSERALFVLDGRGIVRWRYISPRGINPGMDGILSALESLDSTGNRS